MLGDNKGSGGHDREKTRWKDTLEVVFKEAAPQGGDIWVENEKEKLSQACREQHPNQRNGI